MNTPTSVFDRLLAIVLTIAAFAMAVTLVQRERRASLNTRSAEARIAYVPEWKEALSLSIPRDTRAAPVTIVEVIDLECRACARFSSIARDLERRFVDSLAVVLLHYPLSQHQFAREAAHAAECSDQAGVAAAFVETVLAKQDSLGKLEWGGLASRAGIKDLSAFRDCMNDPLTTMRIDSAIVLAKRLRAVGTPTIIVNGWRIRGPLTTELIGTVVGELLAGRDPRKAVRELSD